MGVDVRCLAGQCIDVIDPKDVVGGGRFICSGKDNAQRAEQQRGEHDGKRFLHNVLILSNLYRVI